MLSYGTTVVYVRFVTGQIGIRRSMSVYDAKMEEEEEREEADQGEEEGTALFPLGSLAEPGWVTSEL